MEDTSEKLFSEKEAARYFGWSIDKMRQIRKRGDIEYFKFNEQLIKYSLKQLEEYKNRFLQQAS